VSPIYSGLHRQTQLRHVVLELHNSGRSSFGIPEEKDDKLVKTRVHWIRIPSLLILYKYKLHL